MGQSIRSKNKAEERLPVDREKLNVGNSNTSIPEYYYDMEFICRECGAPEIWTADQQKWWYEEKRGYILSTAVLCKECRRSKKSKKKKALKEAKNKNDI